MVFATTTRIMPAAFLFGFLALFALAAPKAAQAAGDLPPPIGPIEPRVMPIKGDDALYHQSWFLNSFLDLREDFAEAKASGKRLAVLFEQRGCVYCIKMHTEVLSQRYINEFVRKHFAILQLNLWGDREVTDFDGKVMSEKRLAERWGVLFTPTIVFLTDELPPDADKKTGRDLEVMRMSLGIGPGTFYDVFTWIAYKVYEKDRNFQRFHLARIAEREALAAKAKAKAEGDKSGRGEGGEGEKSAPNEGAKTSIN